MTPRSKVMLSLFTVPAALVLLLAAASLTLALAASPPEPSGIEVTTATGSAGSVISLWAPGTSEDVWTRSMPSPNEPSETSWMVASYNGIPGGASVRSGSESQEIAPRLFIPRADLDSTLYIQNPAGSGPATVLVTFYDSSGALVHSEFPMIPGHGSLGLELASLSGLPPGYDGGAVLEFDSPVEAVVNVQPDATGILLSYGAVETTDRMVVLPEVFRDYYGYNSSFWVQNAGVNTADITVTYYHGDGSVVHTTTDSIAPSASRAHHLADEMGLVAGFQGLALIESSEPVAIAVETSSLQAQQGLASRGIPLTHSHPTILAPLQQKLAGIVSGGSIVNLGSEQAIIETNWYSEYGSTVYTQTVPILSLVRWNYVLLAMPDLPDGFDGSLVASSAGQPLVGIVHWADSTLAGDTVTASPAIGLSQVGDLAYLPRVVHSVSLQAFTEFSIQNAASGGAVDVTITFYDQSGAASATVADTIPFHGVRRYATGEIVALGDEWEGSVIVDATQPIAVEVRQQLLVSEPSTCPVVTDPGDSGPSTLRGCLAGASSGDTITFDPAIFPPANPVTISLESILPYIITDALTIDASDAGVILDGMAIVDSSAGQSGLVIDGASGCAIRGLQVVNFPYYGLEIWGGEYNEIGGDRNVGVGPMGQGNLISGNCYGLQIVGSTAMSNTVIGNFIGTDLSGAAAVGGRCGATNGMQVGADYNQIGSTQLGEHNIVAGYMGLAPPYMAPANNRIVGNYVGLDVSGTTCIGSGWSGIGV